MENISEEITIRVNDVLRKYGLKTLFVDVQTIRTREGFFSKDCNLWEIMTKECFETVDLNWMPFLFDTYELSEDMVPREVSILQDVYEESLMDIARFFYVKDEDEILSLSIAQLEKKLPKNRFQSLHKKFESVIAEYTFDELVESGLLKRLYGIQYPETTFDIGEILGCWTIYFIPEREDEDIAWEVGLVPFRHNGQMYLALGGCGMDLSPRLDAYQALVDGSISDNSEFLRDTDYAKYVVGEEIHRKVMEAIRISPVIHILTSKAS